LNAEIAELSRVLLCGLRGLCVELRITAQITEKHTLGFGSVSSVSSVVDVKLILDPGTLAGC